MLTLEQKRQFMVDGYLHVPGVVPRQMVDDALRAINHSIGNVGRTGGDPVRFREDSFCHELTGDPLMTDIINKTDIPTLVEDLIGAGNMQSVTRVQIAPRFPLPPDQEPEPYGGHLDGIGVGTNGMAKGVYVRNFTIFVVVYLVDVSQPESGNFTVWPHSHIEFEEHFRRVGHEVMAEGIPQIDLTRERVMVTGSAGDVILAHHQLHHTAGHNLSPHVRHALISRVRHRKTEEVGKAAYTDIWREWEGLAKLVPEAV